MQPRVAPALLFALLLAAPSAFAAWSTKGAFEPDTPFDHESALMRLQPDLDPSAQRNLLYFNGFGTFGGGLATTLNPNLATLETAIAPAPFQAVALFGVWKDCNGDGFVGLGDNGLLEYPSQLLTDASVCPPATPDPARPWMTRNDGSWVVEFTPVGYDDITTPQDENRLTINDTSARVWADWGLPGAAADGTCATTPAPRGTFRSTGGLLGFADCFLGYQGAATITAAAEAAGHPELGFSDAPEGHPDDSASPLNRENPWGNESDRALVTAFDCRESIPVVVEDPTGGVLAPLAGEDGELVSLDARAPLLEIDPTGSPAGAVNETEAGIDDCDRSDTDEVVDTDGHRAGSDGDLPYALEGRAESARPGARRTRTDHVLAFEEGMRNDLLAVALGERTREHAGVGLTTLTGFWVGASTGGVGRNAFVSRQTLGPEPASHLTYYAWLSERAILLNGLQPPGPGTGFYGVEGCSLGTFECDAAKWWLDDAGHDITPRDSRLGVDPNDPTVPDETDATRIGVRIGQPYRMRDIDCVDASFREARAAGVQWGHPTGSRCERG